MSGGGPPTRTGDEALRASPGFLSLEVRCRRCPSWGGERGRIGWVNADYFCGDGLPRMDDPPAVADPETWGQGTRWAPFGRGVEQVSIGPGRERAYLLRCPVRGCRVEPVVLSWEQLRRRVLRALARGERVMWVG